MTGRFKTKDAMGDRRDVIKEILTDPDQRYDFAINAVIRMQEREGDEISYEQAEEIFERILEETNPNKDTRS